MNLNIEVIITVLIGLVVVYVVFHQNRRAEQVLEKRLTSLQSTLHHSSMVLDEYQKFKTAFTHSYDAMVITDKDGKIVFMNKSASRVSGYSEAEMLGVKAEELWGIHMPKHYYQKLWHRISVDQKPFFGRLTNRRKNGEPYQAAISITPIFEDESEVTVAYFVAVERDLAQAELP